MYTCHAYSAKLHFPDPPDMLHSVELGRILSELLALGFGHLAIETQNHWPQCNSVLDDHVLRPL